MQLSLLLPLGTAWVAHRTPMVAAVSRRPTTTRLFVSMSDSNTNDSSSSTTTPLSTTTTTTTTESLCDKLAVTHTPVDWDWEALVKQSFAVSSKPIILFDGVCLFCNAGVDLCLDLDKNEHFRFASLQSKVGQSLLIKNGKEPNDLSSIVLVESESQAYFESDAILRIAKELGNLPKFIRFFSKASLKYMPTFIRDGAYHLVANNRYIFGHKEECSLDLDGNIARRFVQDPE